METASFTVSENKNYWNLMILHALHIHTLAKEHLLVHFTVSQRFQDKIIQEKKTTKLEKYPQ